MLIKLLDELKNGSALDMHDLAGRLGVSHNQIVMMLEDLERMGKVRKTDFCNTSGCSDCPTASRCNTGDRKTLTWEYLGD